MYIAQRFAGLCLVAAFAASAGAMSVNLNFGATVDDSNTNTPGHVVGGIVGTSWNLITGDTNSGFVDDGNNPITLEVDLGKETGATTNVINWGASGFSNSGLGNHINTDLYAGNTRSATFVNDGNESQIELGARIKGLMAGNYDVYLTARNTNIDPDPPGNNDPDKDEYDVFFTNVATASGNTNYGALASSLLTNTEQSAFDGDVNSNAWIDGDSYVLGTVTLGVDEDLVVITRGITEESGGNTSDQLRGFINSIQLVKQPDDTGEPGDAAPAVPEPMVAALSLLGLATLATRRRR